MKTAFFIVAILAALWLARDPGELTRADFDYCQRVAWDVHSNYRGIDCAAAVAAHGAAMAGE